MLWISIRSGWEASVVSLTAERSQDDAANGGKRAIQAASCSNGERGGRDRERERRERSSSLQIASKIKHGLYIKRNLLRRPADCLSTVQASGPRSSQGDRFPSASGGAILPTEARRGSDRDALPRSPRTINSSGPATASETSIPDQYFRVPTRQTPPFDIPACRSAQIRAHRRGCSVLLRSSRGCRIERTLRWRACDESRRRLGSSAASELL